MLRQYELVERVKEYDPDADEAMLNRAYVYTVQKHGTQTRASGDPYFSHPVEVAGLMTDLKLDQETIATALLHDTVEDTLVTIDASNSLISDNDFTGFTNRYATALRVRKDGTEISNNTFDASASGSPNTAYVYVSTDNPGPATNNTFVAVDGGENTRFRTHLAGEQGEGSDVSLGNLVASFSQCAG